jgi:hypothetical protein
MLVAVIRNMCPNAMPYYPTREQMHRATVVLGQKENKQEIGMRLKLFSIALLLCGGQLAHAESAFSGGITSGNLSVWRINESSGQVSLCSFANKTTPVSCAPWSAKEPAGGDFRLIVGNDLLSVWRMNRASGAVSLCEYKDVEKEPHCTPWN